MTDHLKELSERAMDGLLTATGPDHFGDFTIQINGEGLAVAAVCNGDMWRMGGHFERHKANAEFLVALWNAYRSGSLIPADQGRVEELEAENARLKEALKPFAETLVAQVDVDLPQQDWRDEDYDTVVRIRTSHARRGLPDLSEDMTLAVGDFRNARATLSRKGEG